MSEQNKHVLDLDFKDFRVELRGNRQELEKHEQRGFFAIHFKAQNVTCYTSVGINVTWNYVAWGYLNTDLVIEVVSFPDETAVFTSYGGHTESFFRRVAAFLGIKWLEPNDRSPLAPESQKPKKLPRKKKKKILKIKK